MTLRQANTVLGAMMWASVAIAPSTSVFAQSPATEDHPALTLNADAPVTEDHPSLSIAGAPVSITQTDEAKSAATKKKDQVTAGILMLNQAVDVPGLTSGPQTADPMPVLSGNMAPDQKNSVPENSDKPVQTAEPDTADPSKAPDAPPSSELAAQPPEPVMLEHPTVADTSKLVSEAKTVSLTGVVGLKGQYADALHGAIVGDGDKVICQFQSDSNYICLLADGIDVAALALRNGAAQTSSSSPAAYRDLEALARDERRGVWSSLPPPPVHVEHPTVTNTATLTSSGKVYLLDGVIGLGDQYARDLQAYISANGDSVMCNPQGEAGHYVCLMADGTDVAKAALVNGAARVAGDAPDSYRVEQGDALANKRGYWKNPPPDVLVAAATGGGSPSPTYKLASGDDGSDGVVYVGSAPAAVIEGETVFLSYGGDDLGWGYYDHGHHWHGAPGHVGEHMERFHPGGAGLRGYAGRMDAGIRGAPGRPMMAGGPMPGHMAGGFVRPGPSPMAFHPAAAAFHPAAAVHAAPAAHVGGGRH